MSLYPEKYDEDYILIRHRKENEITNKSKSGILRRLKPVKGISKMESDDIQNNKSGWIVDVNNKIKLLEILNIYNQKYPMEPYKNQYTIEDLTSFGHKDGFIEDNTLGNDNVKFIIPPDRHEVNETNEFSVVPERHELDETVMDTEFCKMNEPNDIVPDTHEANELDDVVVDTHEVNELDDVVADTQEMIELDDIYISKLKQIDIMKSKLFEKFKEKEDLLREEFKNKEKKFNEYKNQKEQELKELFQKQKIYKKKIEQQDIKQYDYVKEKQKKEEELNKMFIEKEQEFKQTLLKKFEIGKEKVENRLKEMEDSGIKKINDKLVIEEKKINLTEDEIIKSKIKNFKKKLDFYKSFSLIPSQFEEKNERTEKSLPSSIDSYYSDDSLEFDTSPKTDNVNDLVNKLKFLEKKILNIELVNKRNK